jgi:hypothetical protein
LGRKTGIDMGQNGRIEKKRGLSGFGRKTGMNMGQNGRIEKEGKEGGVWALGEDRDGYGSKWESREKLRMQKVKDLDRNGLFDLGQRGA